MRNPGQPKRYTRTEKWLIGLELSTGAAALVSGALLAARPDGSFLHADPRVLGRTPFRDWRLPGLLLAAGCGGGYLATGLLQLRRHRAARPLAVTAGMAAGVILTVLAALVPARAATAVAPLAALHALAAPAEQLERALEGLLRDGLAETTGAGVRLPV